MLASQPVQRSKQHFVVIVVGFLIGIRHFAIYKNRPLGRYLDAMLVALIWLWGWRLDAA